jgi:hypothetical protein
MNDFIEHILFQFGNMPAEVNLPFGASCKRYYTTQCTTMIFITRIAKGCFAFLAFFCLQFCHAK